jgi:hypothetical protein
VHEGFQLVYYSIRASLHNLVQKNAPRCKDLLITGHSLGGALCALAAPDLLNDIATLSPVVYTWAEPRVGHDDFVSFFNTHVNVCYRMVNVWDVVPHLPPDLAGYEHEGSGVTIDSGFSLDVVHNHVLSTGYARHCQVERQTPAAEHRTFRKDGSRGNDWANRLKRIGRQVRSRFDCVQGGLCPALSQSCHPERSGIIRLRMILRSRGTCCLPAASRGSGTVTDTTEPRPPLHPRSAVARGLSIAG